MTTLVLENQNGKRVEIKVFRWYPTKDGITAYGVDGWTHISSKEWTLWEVK